MKKLKERWDIEHNWQLLFPFLGVIVLAYSSYKLLSLFPKNFHFGIKLLISVVFYFVLLKIIFFIFDKLKNKWKVTYKWEMINIFLVFAFTGSSSVFVIRPIMKIVGITRENLSPFIFWILFIFLGFIFYQILLLLFGWLFGQYKFFWDFEKKMLRRIGLKRFVD